MILHITISGRAVAVEVDEARYRAAIHRLAAVLATAGEREPDAVSKAPSV